jgi:hypothetical protein|tara:strand:- start:1556 stop:1768 length:213 start_codon:yes stop_codon:yes gene_type:complete
MQVKVAKEGWVPLTEDNEQALEVMDLTAQALQSSLDIGIVDDVEDLGVGTEDARRIKVSVSVKIEDKTNS